MIWLHFFTSQGAAASQERVTPRGGQPSGVEVATKLMMEPRDDDEDTGKKKKSAFRRRTNGFSLINYWAYDTECRLLFKFYFYELLDLHSYYFSEMKSARGTGSFGRESMHSTME